MAEGVDCVNTLVRCQWDGWMNGWWITWSIYMQEKLLVFCYRTIVGLVQHYLCCDVWRSASQIRADQKMFNFISHQ